MEQNDRIAVSVAFLSGIALAVLAIQAAGFGHGDYLPGALSFGPVSVVGYYFGYEFWFILGPILFIVYSQILRYYQSLKRPALGFIYISIFHNSFVLFQAEHYMNELERFHNSPTRYYAYAMYLIMLLLYILAFRYTCRKELKSK